MSKKRQINVKTFMWSLTINLYGSSSKPSFHFIMNFQWLTPRVKITTFITTTQEKIINLTTKFQKDEENIPSPFS